MHLKAVEIHGFKSFGERIYIEFDKGITSIVGPNGSGKSNIMDAVLWVLGEQSYKNIRAKDSGDIVFSGAGKSAGSAEVSLFIDNLDRFFDLESDEVKITRKLHKSGDNEYFINNSRARLKDISTLFMDTGVGKAAYSVIGQGKVERIISSSNKEIKQIIEEAAGIKKFQMNKQESLKNLKSLDDELEKVSLVKNQIFENKNHIEKQATKAKEFLKLKEEKELLEKGILSFELEKKSDQLSETVLKNEKTVQECQETERLIVENDNNFEKNELERESLQKEIDENAAKNQELKELIELSEREKARILERVASFDREILEKIEMSERGKGRVEAQKEHIEKLKEEKDGTLLKLQGLEEENTLFSKEIDEIEGKKREREIEQDIRKRKLMDFEVDKLRMVNEIENSARRAKSSEAKIESLKKEIQEIEVKLSQYDLEERELSEKKIEWENKVKTVQERIEFLESKISEDSISMNRVSEKYREIEYEEKRARLRFENLERLEQSNEGLYPGVKEILNAKISGVHGIVASLINIPEGLEKAMEASISGNLQDIVVENSDVAKRGIQLLKESKAGRASFLALDTIKWSSSKKNWKKENGVIGIASTLITAEERYIGVVELLLGNLLVVESVDCALGILRRGEHSGNIVTVSGELLSSRGRITGGESKNSTIGQLLERKKEKSLLKESLERYTKEGKKLQGEIEKYRDELEKYENEIFDIDSKEESTKKELKRISGELEEKKVRRDRTQRDLFVIKSEYSSEIEYGEEFSKKIGSSTDDKVAVELKIQETRKEMERVGEDINELQECIRVKKEQYSDIRIKYLNTQNRKEQIDGDILKLDKELETLISDLLEMEGRVLEVKEAKVKGIEKIKEIEVECEERSKIYNEENSEINSKKERIGKLSEEERALIEEKKKLESKIIKMRDQNLKEVEFLDRIRFDIERVTTQLLELSEIELREIKAEEYDQLKNRVRTLENRLKNFETVNLLAIEEFEQLEEKYQYLNSQFLDMNQSKTALHKMIQEISHEIDTRFKHAHSEIDRNFNEMCNDILQNSEGKLLLTEGENLEDSGIDIVVKFKNKRQQSLSLFSGGEKSMVAIAFIMGIFMYKPSPFTFLDEIEAALDDKNTRKLITKLKEFTGKSQFILITHNKETMRESDTIFGVTMNKEIGISKIVPVKF